MTNLHDKDDMSMDDILKSIRKYVSEEAAQKQEQHTHNHQPTNDINDVASRSSEDASDTIVLQPEDIVHEEEPVQSVTSAVNDPIVYSEVQKQESKSQPFNKLTEILRIKKETDQKDNVVQNKSSGITLDEFFRAIATETTEKWISMHLRKIVEEIVQREIEKIKSE